MTFAAYAEGWLAGFIVDAPDRTRFEAALQHRLVPVLGEWPLLEVLEADRNELYRQVMDAGWDGDDEATRECLHLILADAAEDLRIEIFDVSANAREARSGRWLVRSGARRGQPAGRRRSRAAVPSK